jgi:hypothetical protein
MATTTMTKMPMATQRLQHARLLDRRSWYQLWKLAVAWQRTQAPVARDLLLQISYFELCLEWILRLE